jgi:hypothetical protein
MPHRDALLKRMLLVAGDLPRHIAMQEASARKYVERPNTLHPDPAPVTPELLRRHLDGEITLGSYLALADGTTWAVCWDADTPEGWETLLQAGRKLLRSGAKPIAERSPAGAEHAGGGHLWLVFRRPVDPRAARATAERHAPELRDFPEFWPGGGAVRLLGALYRRGGTRAWCEAAALRRPDEWLTSWEAASLAWSEDTHSGWVTEPAPAVTPRERPERAPVAPLDTRRVSAPPRPEPEAWGHPWWAARYGRARRSLAWAICPPQAIRWYNSLHDIRGILPKEANGYARATWRDERTPSVGYRPGNRWMDYGRNARDGRKGGDAFEAFCLKYHDGDRGKALAVVTREMRAAAEAQLRTAAAEGRGVPGWVAEIMGPAGWASYEALRAAQRAAERDPGLSP